MKEISIKINGLEANILYDLLSYQKLQLVIATKQDVFKDNDYLIEVIDKVNNQIEDLLKWEK